MRRHETKRIVGMGCILFLGMLCLSLALSAQEGRGKGRINGTVVDSDGNPLEGVVITAIHVASGTSFKEKSNEKGRWAIGGLGTGNFRFTAEMDGYEPEFFDVRVSQFSRNNPSIAFTLQKTRAESAKMPGVEDSETVVLFEEGNQLFNEGNYAEAAAKFQEFLGKNPEFIPAHLNLGNCYRALEDYEKANASYTYILAHIQETEGTLEGNRLAAGALAAMGETAMLQGDLEQASSHLEQAMAIYPNETLAFNIGEIYFKQGDAVKGTEYFNQAIEIKADWAPPYRQRGYALLNQADYKGALESFQKFLELDPDAPQAPTIKALIPQLESMIKK